MPIDNYKDKVNIIANIYTMRATLRRTSTPLLKKCIVPAAKRIGADLFEIADPETGEVVKGRQKLET